MHKCGAIAFMIATAAVQTAHAQAWTAQVYDASSGENEVASYTPLEKASKPWNLCVLFPHMKDSFWLAVNYGVAEEAKRQGVNMTLYEAGGYENLPRQLSQFDDCLASGVDAIIVGPISEAGLTQKIDEAVGRGIPVIATVNPVSEAKVAGKMFASFSALGQATGTFLKEHLQGQTATAVAFPGPAGSGWAEGYYEGFENAVKDSSITVADAMYGDTGVGVQQQLIQDALQAYPEMNVIWGSAPTAEAAIGAVAEIGLQDQIMIVSTYENQAMLNALNSGEILAFATQYPVLEGRVAIDMAVRALEKQPVMPFIQPIPEVINTETVGKIDMSLVLAPADFSPAYSVTAE